MPNSQTDSISCVDIRRDYLFTYGDLSNPNVLDPQTIGHAPIGDVCVQWFIPTDTYQQLVEGTDYTVDLTTGVITLLAVHGFGESGAGQESWLVDVWYNVLPAPVAARCPGIECCEDDPSGYVSAAGEGKGYNSTCEPLPRVVFEPVSGSRLILPSLVTLRSDNPLAVVHYTVDGSEPDADSTVYSTPINVDSPGTIIRAVAIVAGCPAGPESNAQYQTWSPAAAFTYACTTTDRSGQWGAFAANGIPDLNWELQIQFTAITGVARFDILQLDSSGKFTGAAWSTKEIIYPWEYDATKEHEPFPLVIWVGGVQQNVAYLDNYSASLGDFGVGAHTLDMHGEPWWTLANSFFKLIVTFSDGSTISKIVDDTCDALPAALCAVPTFTLTPACGPYRIDVTFTTTIGREYIIYRRLSGSTGFYDLLANANAVSSPQTFQDTTVAAGEQYEYLFAHKPPLCTDFVFAPLQLATAIADPIVAIGAFPETINQGASTTISWDSLEITGNVTISPTIGAQPGNLAGSQVVSPAVTTVYTITGDNACGTTAQAQVTVTVIVAATCGAVQPATVGLENYTDLSLATAIASCPTLDYGGVVAWHGRFENTVGCIFQTPDFPFRFAFVFGQPDGRLLDVADTKITISGGLWVLQIYGYIGGVPTDIWTGTKAFGDTPVGDYTRVSGCSIIGTETIIEIT